MSFTNAEAKATLDARFPTTGATDHIAYSANGSSETPSLARTAIGATGWAAATTANPAVKSNANALTTAAASGPVTITHVSVFTESVGGTQRTEWQSLTTARTLASGNTGTWPVGALKITLT